MTANSVGLVGAGHAAGRLVHIGDVDLDRGVILGGNDSVASRAKIEKDNIDIKLIYLFKSRDLLKIQEPRGRAV